MYPYVTKKRPISFRQLRAVDLWLKYGRRSKARALREAGYSKAIIRQPHKVFNSPAVREELDKRGFGFTGIHDNLEPQGKPIPIYRPTIDFSSVSLEQWQVLKEKLRVIGYETPPVQAINGNIIPNQSWL